MAEPKVEITLRTKADTAGAVQASGAIDDLTDGVKDLNRNIAATGRETPRELAKLEQAAERAGQELRQMDRGATAAAGGKRNLGLATLEASRAIEDLQYGIGGVLNNIPGLVAMLGGGAGLAGVISLAAVAMTQLAPLLFDTGEAAGDAAPKMDAQARAAQAAEASNQALSNTLRDQREAYDQLIAEMERAQEVLQQLNREQEAGADLQYKMDLAAIEDSDMTPAEKAQAIADLKISRATGQQARADAADAATVQAMAGELAAQQGRVGQAAGTAAELQRRQREAELNRIAREQVGAIRGSEEFRSLEAQRISTEARGEDFAQRFPDQAARLAELQAMVSQAEQVQAANRPGDEALLTKQLTEAMDALREEVIKLQEAEADLATEQTKASSRMRERDLRTQGEIFDVETSRDRTIRNIEAQDAARAAQEAEAARKAEEARLQAEGRQIGGQLTAVARDQARTGVGGQQDAATQALERAAGTLEDGATADEARQVRETLERVGAAIIGNDEQTRAELRALRDRLIQLEGQLANQRA